MEKDYNLLIALYVCLGILFVAVYELLKTYLIKDDAKDEQEEEN